ncbi:transmembrane protein, putative [Medicago truncatula]|uniref:Transmembrane protein, putative n=1 Tax=Medicago truncatula TaxID=3880 RepID=G7L1X6_MEDTR|nr:transmembrane protein, putative [Medicago truncatula]
MGMSWVVHSPIIIVFFSLSYALYALAFAITHDMQSSYHSKYPLPHPTHNIVVINSVHPFNLRSDLDLHRRDIITTPPTAVFLSFLSSRGWWSMLITMVVVMRTVVDNGGSEEDVGRIGKENTQRRERKKREEEEDCGVFTKLPLFKG